MAQKPHVLERDHALSARQSDSQGGRMRSLAVFVAILVVGILARIPAYLAYKPVWSADSSMYTFPFFMWSHHLFCWGVRTPGYPLFLGLAQTLAGTPASFLTFPASAAYITVFVQSALNIVACMFLYQALLKLGIRKHLAVATSLVCVSVAGLGLFEVNLLNYSVAFSLLTVGAACFAFTMRKIADGQRATSLAFLTGVSFSVAALVRPEVLVFVASLILILLFVILRATLRKTGSDYTKGLARFALLVLVGVSPLQLAWMTWNYVGIGQFRITTLTGWNRCKTVYNIFDRVDEKDRTAGDILNRSYLARNKNGVIVRDHYWQAMQELLSRSSELPMGADPTEQISDFHAKLDDFFLKAFGMRSRVPCELPGIYCSAPARQFANVGDYIGTVSSGLIRKYPEVYLRNVADNFVRDTFDFRYTETTPAFEGATYTSPSGDSCVRYAGFANALRWAVLVEAPFLTVVYIITLGIVLLAPVIMKDGESAGSVSNVTVVALAVAAFGTVVATCFIAGYNKEYSIPLLGVLFICVGYAVNNWNQAKVVWNSR